MSLLLSFINIIPPPPPPTPTPSGGGGGGSSHYQSTDNRELKELENRTNKLKIEDDELELIIKMWMKIKNN